MFGDFESIDWAKYDVTLERTDLETLARLKSSTAQVKRALRHIETAIYDQGAPRRGAARPWW